MKKMVCEICGSQTLRKENGVFVCQECGTEYSVEEAKLLLKELVDSTEEQALNINTTNVVSKHANLNISVDNDDVKYLASQLKSWAVLCALAEQINYYLRINGTVNVDVDYFWSKNKEYSCLSIDSFQTFGLSTVSLEMESTQFVRNLQNDDKFMTVIRTMIETKDDKWNEYGFGGLTDSYYCNYICSLDGKYKQLIRDVFIESDPSGFYGLKNLVMDYKDKKTIYGWLKKYSKSGLFKVKPVSEFQYNQEKDIQYVINELAKSFDAGKSKMAESYSEYKKACESFLTIRNNIIDEANQLETIFLLPVEYRSSSKIYKLLDILNQGRAKDWKELANLYDTIVYRNDVRHSFSQLINLIENTNKILLKGFSLINNNLNSINKNISSISSDISDVIQELQQIKKVEIAQLTMTALLN